MYELTNFNTVQINQSKCIKFMIIYFKKLIGQFKKLNLFELINLDRDKFNKRK